MVAHDASNRNRPPLHESSLIYHELERITAAWENACFFAHYPLADTLLAERNALIATINCHNEQVVR